MDLDTAKQIAELSCLERRTIPAIKLLRAHTNMGLAEAKNYLESYSHNGEWEEALLKQLCKDFVQNKKDLLIRAENDLHELQDYVEQLRLEIDQEDNPTNQGEASD